MRTVRVRLKELMEKRKITQERLSEDTGIPQGTISRWAGNKIDRLDRHIMTKLCEYFKIEIGELLEVDPPVGKDE